MSTMEGIQKITRADIESRVERVNQRFRQFTYRDSEKGSLDLVQMVFALHPSDDLLPTPVEAEILNAVRDGFALLNFLCMKFQQAPGMGFSVTPATAEEESNMFTITALAKSISSSYMLARLGNRIAELDGYQEEERKQGFFSFKESTGDAFDGTIKKYAESIASFLRQSRNSETTYQDSDFLHLTSEFFSYLRETNGQIANELQPQQKEFVDSLILDIDGVVTVNGFEPDAKVEVSRKVDKEFKKVRPEEVVGNRFAKQQVWRFMERLALYNSEFKRNPILEFGGLPWTVLWDGIPGTGKSTLIAMAISRLMELGEAVGKEVNVVQIDQSIKNEFYGKTAQNLQELLSTTHDPERLHLVILDDIDMLMSGDRNSGSGGADKDIANILMQYLEGVKTVIAGNNQVYCASNEPTGLDRALRNRMQFRLNIDGPETSEDFADLFCILTGEALKSGLISVEHGYEPLSTQDNYDYEGGRWLKKGQDVEKESEIVDSSKAPKSIIEFGEMIGALKTKIPSISGRSMKAIIEAVKTRMADFDIPGDWLTKPSVFLLREFETQTRMVKELYVPFTSEMFYEEAIRYAESERRYADEERERMADQAFKNLTAQLDAQQRLKANSE